MEIKKKLKVDEYVFEIEGKDIYNTYITYSIGSYESSVYKDGRKCDNIVHSVLSIELNGKDKNENDAWISFYLDFDYFNSLSKIPTDISYFLENSESFVKMLDEDKSMFLDFDLPCNRKMIFIKNFHHYGYLK